MYRRLATSCVLFALIPVVVRVLTPEAESARATLAAVVQREQRANVRESHGELAGECFTWVDLEEFARARTAELIVRRIRRDTPFLQVVAALKRLSPQERVAVLGACRKPLRPTWRQLGRISPAGTTDAGQRAEQIIADNIVTVAAELAGDGPGVSAKH